MVELCSNSLSNQPSLDNSDPSDNMSAVGLLPSVPVEQSSQRSLDQVHVERPPAEPPPSLPSSPVDDDSTSVHSGCSAVSTDSSSSSTSAESLELDAHRWARHALAADDSTRKIGNLSQPIIQDDSDLPSGPTRHVLNRLEDNISPAEVRDFEHMPFVESTPCDDVPGPTENPFQDIMDALTKDRVVPAICTTRVITFDLDPTIAVVDNAPDDDDTASISSDTSIWSLTDGGANVCMTADKNMLVDVKPIRPVRVGLAVNGSEGSASYCTHRGFLPMSCTDGTIHYQKFLVNSASSDTIIAPECVMSSHPKLVRWVQTGYQGTDSPGSLQFFDSDDNVLLDLKLCKRNGLYYCSNEVLTTTGDTVRPVYSPEIRQVLMDNIPCLSEEDPYGLSIFDCSDDDEFFTRLKAVRDGDSDNMDLHANVARRLRDPVTPSKQLEGELWSARLGGCSPEQLTNITDHATGLPTKNFQVHPLRFVDPEKWAQIRKQPATKVAERATARAQRMFMDYGFMRASTSNFTKPNPKKDRVVLSYDGFSSYLAIVDDYSRYMWIFLRKSKEPPIEQATQLLTLNGRRSKEGELIGGVIRCDQGGELARCTEFRSTMLDKCNYVVEPTGADSPSQNGGWNDGIRHWVIRYVPYSTVRLSLLNIGLQHSSTQRTY